MNVEVAPKEGFRNPGRRIGRNELCPCGSGMKLKNCHRGGFMQEQSSSPIEMPEKVFGIEILNKEVSIEVQQSITLNDWAIMSYKANARMRDLPDGPIRDRKIQIVLAADGSVDVRGDKINLSEWALMCWIADSMLRRNFMKLLQANEQAQVQQMQMQQQRAQRLHQQIINGRG